MELPDQLQLPCPIRRIFFWTLSDAARTEVRSRLPIQEGGILSEDLLRQSVQALKDFDQRLDVMINKVPDDAVNFTVYDSAAFPCRIKIEAAQQAAMLTDYAMPVFPANADGQVQLEVVIGKDGSVLEAGPLSGPEALIAPAMRAVRQWRYRTTRLNGVRVEVRTTVDLDIGQRPH